MFWILVTLFIFCFGAGILYPLGMIVFYKLRYGKRTTIKRILEDIGW